MIKTVGSVCSGIEAATVAWEPLGMSFQWLSEIAPFPSRVLAEKYPNIQNVGDMNLIPDLVKAETIDAPDLICGGTPCQAFSYAGWQNGLKDDRGNLTLRFVDIVDSVDEVRLKKGQGRSVVFWENVEGVLSDKTNAFGCMISSLAGLDEAISRKRWPTAGILRGKKRNVAWRVLDAKHFGLPQQRRRLYLLSGGKDFNPEDILFEIHKKDAVQVPTFELTKDIDGHSMEVFRSYSDCLYSAYGTKWNGNAAAYNGSLFAVQDGSIRRLSPVECERLMGFPDGYTDVKTATRTTRYQALGNSWAVPVIKWIGERLLSKHLPKLNITNDSGSLYAQLFDDGACLFDFGREMFPAFPNFSLNTTSTPEEPRYECLVNILTPDAPKEIFISPVGCQGILRRKNERNMSINARLEEVLAAGAAQMPKEEIERRSRVQKRGRYSD